MKFVPESIEMLSLGVIQHQPREMIVFAIEQRDRDDFVDGNNLRITQGWRKKLTESFKCSLDALLSFASFRDQDRRRVGDGGIGTRPGAGPSGCVHLSAVETARDL